jgi:hypothetical protein
LTDYHVTGIAEEVCCLVNNMQSAVFVAVLFTFTERLVITQQPGDNEDTIYIPEGTDLQLECRAFGLPPPRYVWFRGNEELKAQTSSTLLITDSG